MPKHAAATPHEPTGPQHLAEPSPAQQEVSQVVPAAEAPVTLLEATQAEHETHTDSRKGAHPAAVVAIVAGIAAVSLYAAAHVFPHTTSGSLEAALGSGTAMGEVEVVEPSAEDLLAASDLADSLFVEAEHRELAHEGSYENVLDPEILNTTQAFAGVSITIGDIEDSGYDVGIMLVDLDTGASFAYNADETFYSASSIKGPYVISLYEELAETGEESLDALNSYALPIIEYSDNGAYSSMHRRYGGDPFQIWLEEIGYDLGEYDNYDEVSDHFYLHINAQQLAALWLRAYPYLTGDSEATELLAEYFESRETSAIGEALGDRYVTWAKAGWYPSNDGYAHPASVDAGIVLADHPYVVAVLTNIPANVERLAPLFSALDELHEGLYLLGGDYRIEPES